MRVAIVTDTNSGISVAEGSGLGVYVLPMPLLVDGEIRYDALKRSNPEQARKLFEKAASQSAERYRYLKKLKDFYEPEPVLPEDSGIQIPKSDS